jgi:8-oxo-dGTP diphosphatase
MSQAHRQCAAAIIQNQQGEILFLEQHNGICGIPGGIVDAGETPPIAAIREALEEANIEVELEYIIGTYLLTGGSWPDIFATVYKAHIVRGEPKAGDADEIRAVLWGSPHDLPSPLITDAKAAVEDLLLGNRGVVRTVECTGVMPKLEED